MSQLRLTLPRGRWWSFAIATGLLAGVLPVLFFAAPSAAFLMVVCLLGFAILILGWPFSGVVVLLLAPLFTHFRFDVGPISVRPEHVAVLLVAVVGGMQLFVQKGRLRLPWSARLALAWWAINMLAGLFFSPVRSVGLQNGLRIGASVIAFILVLNLIPDRRRWWWAVWLFITLGVAEAAFGILARALYPAVNLGVQVAWNFTEPIPYGTFEEGNLFGSHIAAWAVAALMLLYAVDRTHMGRRRYLALLLGLGVLLLGLFLSLSRAAWLTFMAGAAVVWVFQRRNAWLQTHRSLLMLAGVPFFVFMTLQVAAYLPSSWPFVDRLQSFVQLGTDATFSARLSDWRLAAQDWLRRPLMGWGPGSFAEMHGLLRARPAWISNLSLRLVQETGLVGLLVFAAFVVSLLVPAVRVIRRLQEPVDRAALLGLVIGYAMLLAIAYQSTDGIWLAASWVHAGLIAAGTRVLRAPA